MLVVFVTYPERAVRIRLWTEVVLGAAGWSRRGRKAQRGRLAIASPDRSASTYLPGSLSF
jgi:hypothetical protein